jgi:hypothetical protein
MKPEQMFSDVSSINIPHAHVVAGDLLDSNARYLQDGTFTLYVS